MRRFFLFENFLLNLHIAKIKQWQNNKYYYYLYLKQIARSLERQRLVDLVKLLLVCRCKRLGIVVAVGESPGNASIAHKCRKSNDTLAFRYSEVQIGIMACNEITA